MSIQALTWVIYGVASDIKHADFRTPTMPTLKAWERIRAGARSAG